METLFFNLVEPGDRVLVCVNGAFGARMREVAARAGAELHTLEAAWGRPFDLDAVADAAERLKPKLVAIVHAETSTGVHQPLAGLAETVHRQAGMLLVDCVTSLGGAPVEVDGWGIDAAYSATQKCISCPPGLSPITLSPRAVERLEARRHPVQSWYLDLTLVRKYWGEERSYHHTAPINMLYGLREALRIVLEETLEQRHTRHRDVHLLLKSGLERLGIEYLSAEGFHLPMLNAVRVPDGVDDVATRRMLLETYGIEIGGGLGAFKSKAFRIGLMGHGATRENVHTVLAALEQLLTE